MLEEAAVSKQRLPSRSCLFFAFVALQELKKQRVEEGRNADARGRGDGAGAGDERPGGGSGGGGRKSKPVFLDKMRGEQVDGMGLEERMKRNRHYQQRGADVHNFMERG